MFSKFSVFVFCLCGNMFSCLSSIVSEHIYIVRPDIFSFSAMLMIFKLPKGFTWLTLYINL